MLGLFKSKKKLNHANILVVDDEPDLLDTVKCHLRWSNYEVIIAANGQEGLEKAAEEKPNLILLDTNMPVMNGHEMLHHLRKDQNLKDIPVIMVTAICEAEDVAKASSYDIVDYITKPFDFADMTEKIAKALKARPC